MVPLKDFWDFDVTQGFGPTNVVEDGPYMGFPHFNKGLDFGTPLGTVIRALVGGTVVSTGDVGDGWGQRVWIRDANGHTHNYGHLRKCDVMLHARVQPGDRIGESGSTGKSTGPHLSYDVWDARGQYIDPSGFVWPGAPAEETGPNGRTVRQITGTDYLSARERLWFLAQIGRFDLITDEAKIEAAAEINASGRLVSLSINEIVPQPAPEPVGPNGRTLRQITGTEYLSFREQIFYLTGLGRQGMITIEMRQAAAAEG